MSSSKPVAKIKILDEVNCAIIGLLPDHIFYLYEEYGRKAPGFFFNPKFKLGQWDGKIRYFHKTGKTHVYLLPEIIPKLTALGYSLELVDERVSNLPEVPLIDENYFSHIFHPEFQAPIILRKYQVEAVNAVLSNAGGIIIAGTGAGKTLMNAAIADSYGKFGLRTITIVPSQDLIEQTANEFEICEVDVGRYYAEVKTLDHQHIISTWQSLKNNKKIISEFDVVIVDEAHGIKGNVLQQLLNEHGRHIPVRIGLTGTLPKAETDAMAVRIAVGDVQYTITARQLMDEGYLAQLEIDILQLEEDFKKEYQEFIEEHEQKWLVNPKEKPTYTQFKDGYFPDYTAEKRYLQSNKNRIEWIAEYIMAKRDLRKGNVFCLVNGIPFGKKLAAAIPGAVFVHGKDKQKARQEIYDMFAERDDLVVVASIQIASTGLNIKRIFEMMAIDAGKSFVRIIQTIGRGLRKAEDKDSVRFTDICSDLKYSKKHLAERRKFYREAEYPHKKKKVDYNAHL